MERPQLYSIKKIKDPLGFHKVKVYNGTDILKYILHNRIKAQEKKQDSLYLVSGLEGTGKSMFTLTAYDLYCQLKGEEGNIDNVARNVDELMNRYAKLQRNSFVTLDEAQELASDRWNEKKAKEIKEKFTVMRERAFISMICYPNPLKVSVYFREDRVRGVFFLKHPGCVYYYANSNETPHFAQILESWDKHNRTRSLKQITRYAPDFIMYYPEYVGTLRELYDKRKDENISKVLGNNVTIDIPDNYVSIKDAEKYLRRGRTAIRRLVEQQIIKVYFVGLDRYFTKEDLDSYIKSEQEKLNIQSNGRFPL